MVPAREFPIEYAIGLRPFKLSSFIHVSSHKGLRADRLLWHLYFSVTYLTTTTRSLSHQTIQTMTQTAILTLGAFK